MCLHSTVCARRKMWYDDCGRTKSHPHRQWEGLDGHPLKLNKCGRAECHPQSEAWKGHYMTTHEQECSEGFQVGITTAKAQEEWFRRKIRDQKAPIVTSAKKFRDYIMGVVPVEDPEPVKSKLMGGKSIRRPKK